MTGFQKGDYIFNHAGRVVYLRLTLGGLAEICARLNLENISQISARIRLASKEDLESIFKALSRPAHEDDVEFRAINPFTALPVLADIFEMAFAPLVAGGVDA